jgi:hypothetical protein
MIGAVSTSETSVNLYNTLRRTIPEDSLQDYELLDCKYLKGFCLAVFGDAVLFFAKRN